MVTVTSASPTAPVVFPVTPCSTNSGNMVTLACLATGFTPSAVSFSWTHNDTALTDFIQYPSVLKNDVYSGVSQIRVRREDWENRHPIKCKVEHAAGSKEVNFVRPNVVYQLPNLKVMASEENEEITLSCLANDFTPNVYQFKWLKNGIEVNSSLELTTPSKAKKTAKGTTYSAASFLTQPKDEVSDYTNFMCRFNLGKGAKQQYRNETKEYMSPNMCPSTGDELPEGFSMKVIEPSLEDMLFDRSGQVRCEVTVKKASEVRGLTWMDENKHELKSYTDKPVTVNGGHYVLPLDITFDEWNKGIKRICHVDHQDIPNGKTVEYERVNDKKSRKAPSVFMLTPLVQTRENKVTLTCYVKDFYPEELFVMWLIDDKVSTHEFNTTNSVKTNGAYYAYSHLTIPINEWEVPETVYSCLVYHEAIVQNNNIVRSITQHSSQQTTMVNLNMRVPEMCKAQ